MIVCKFGGTSMADAAQMRKVKSIIDLNPDRRVIVVSAPGKRSREDEKITDLFYFCHRDASAGNDIAPHFSIIRDRISSIASDFGVASSISVTLDEIEAKIRGGASVDYAASRGEFLAGIVMAELLGAVFVDPAEVVLLTDDGRVDDSTYAMVAEKMKGSGRFVLPGFFGSTADGKVKTFSRGGSDISGAIAARAVEAERYENWTDVSGILMADPRVVDNPRTITEITYREIRELASIGASVFHEEAIAPVRSVGVPINVRNTNDPAAEGSMILPARDSSTSPVAGISGKKPYRNLFIEKLMLSRYPAYREELLGLLREKGIVPEFESRGFDSISFLLSDSAVGDEMELLEMVKSRLEPDEVSFRPPMALIGIVGEGMMEKTGLAADFLGALKSAGINVRFINYGGSEITLLIGVDEAKYAEALRVLVDASKDTA
jgi:aspartate kinase